MNDFEETEYHEAGHLALSFVEEEILGPPICLSVIPSADARGYVLKAPGFSHDRLDARTLRAHGRVACAGFVASQLAGGGKDPRSMGSDGIALVKAATFGSLFEGLDEHFIEQSFAGAELQLRAHWGGVREVVRVIRACGGSLTEQYGIPAARDAFWRSTGTLFDEESAYRLLPKIKTVPELVAPILAEFAGMLPPAPPAKGRVVKPRRTYTRTVRL